MVAMIPLLMTTMSTANTSMKVVSLSRYAIKGLSPDNLLDVTIQEAGETFPDDRRFALLKRSKRETKAGTFEASSPKWIHKENFLCAFSSPELMATFETEYTTPQVENGGGYGGKHMLTVWKRDKHVKKEQRKPLLGPLDISTQHGQIEVSNFFSQACGEYVDLVTAAAAGSSQKHTHQFGNTRSGVKMNKGDTRTVHIVNAATVRKVSETLGISLRPNRFRPNIVIDGLEPWKEFDFVGRTLQVDDDTDGGLTFDVLSRTVRCDGIGVDALDDDGPPFVRLDMPKLLAKHYPEHGPYLGVYAAISSPGCIGVGDTLSLV